MTINRKHQIIHHFTIDKWKRLTKYDDMFYFHVFNTLIEAPMNWKINGLDNGLSICHQAISWISADFLSLTNIHVTKPSDFFQGNAFEMLSAK